MFPSLSLFLGVCVWGAKIKTKRKQIAKSIGGGTHKQEISEYYLQTSQVFKWEADEEEDESRLYGRRFTVQHMRNKTREPQI